MSKGSVYSKIKPYLSSFSDKFSSLLKKIRNTRFVKTVFVWKIWRPILINLGLAVVLYVGLFFLLTNHLTKITNHGEKIKLPNFVGKKMNLVKKEVVALGLRPQITDSIYDSIKPTGTVLVQFPLPTSKTSVAVKSGRVISFRVSTKNKFVEIPNLVNKTARYALRLLKSRGLSYQIIKKPVSPNLAGFIFKQEFNGKKITEGTKVRVGSKIILYEGEAVLVQNEVAFPDFYGKTINQVKTELNMLGIKDYIIGCSDCEETKPNYPRNNINDFPRSGNKARVFSTKPSYYEGLTIPKTRQVQINAKIDIIINDQHLNNQEENIDQFETFPNDSL